MIYTFHRKEGWYPVELVNDLQAAHQVLFNLGTIRVVNKETGKVVYEKKIETKDKVLIEHEHYQP